MNNEEIFEKLYSNVNGYDVSNNARKNSDFDTKEFLYGEIPLQTCQDILDEAVPNQNGTFFDLGSGTGKTLVAMSLLSNFKKYIGVELLEGLHDKAEEILEEFKEIKSEIANKIHYENLNIFDADISDASFIILNHPFKDGEAFSQLEEKLLNELKPGTKIVTIIRALRDTRFKNLGSYSYKFSWGSSTAHFFEV